MKLAYTVLSSMAITVTPTLIRIGTLITGPYFYLILLLLNPIEIPDVVVDPFEKAFSLFCHIIRHKWVTLFWPMDYDIDLSVFYLVSGNDVILKPSMNYSFPLCSSE